MIIYPAIDIIKSKCVRLYQGNFDLETVYSLEALSMAKKFVSEGASWLHLVDLDGADNPENSQLSVITEIIKETKVNVQTGGGIRTKSQVENLLTQGASRVIIGSMAVQHPKEVMEWFNYFGTDHLVLAFDVLNKDNQPMITTNAWKNISEYSLFDLIDTYLSVGLKHVLCTNIALDGTLGGPDFKLYDQIIKQFPSLSLQASGGIQSIDDIKLLQNKGLNGAIIGRALYENKFSLPEVLSC
jgi:phosphoribosylformimino-5-aminoimidazole carboxamide ribotide isomerase